MTEDKNNNCCVYVHTTPDGMKYYGVTNNIKERWFQYSYKKHNTPFKDAIERFGWKNIKHDVLYSGLSRDEALKLEDELICKARENGTCLNMLRSGHYTQTDEWRNEQNARSKAYREAHPEECKASGKIWRDTHREEKRTQDRAYYDANKDRINARRRERRNRNKGSK